jgi:hypothetical protein
LRDLWHCAGLRVGSRPEVTGKTLLAERMEVLLMSMTRKAGILVALPMVLAVTSGAATSPTLTYHGVFDPNYTVTSGCLTPAGQVASGVWNVQVPNPDGETASAQLMIQVNGKIKVRGSAKLVLVGSATEDTFVAIQSGQEILTFSLHGEAFIYQVTYGACVITFNGHPTH